MKIRFQQNSRVQYPSGYRAPLRTYLIYMISTFLFVYSIKLSAQQTRSIHLYQAIQIGLQQNIDLELFKNSVDRSKLAVNQEKSAFYPNLMAGISTTKDYQKSSGFRLNQNFNEGQSVNGTLSSNVNVFNGFYDLASLQRAKLELSADSSTYVRQREFIMFAIISQYLQVILDNELVQIEKENLQAQQQQLTQIKAFEKAGNRSKADVFQQQAEIKRAEKRVISAERNYKVNRYQLLQLLRRPPTDVLNIEKIDITKLIALLSEKELEKMVDHAYVRADIKARQLQLKAAKKQVWASQSGYWPSVSLSATTGSNYRNTPVLGDFSDQFFDSNPYATVRLSASIPIFDRFQTRISTERAKIQVRDRNLELENLKLNMGIQVEQSLLDYRTAVQQRDVAQAQYDYAKEALNIMETRYNVGSATFIELSQVRAQHLNASYERTSADYDVVAKWFAVTFYCGSISSGIERLKN